MFSSIESQSPSVVSSRLTSGSAFSLNEWSLIILLGALSGMGPLAIDFYLPSFPSIAKDFGVREALIPLTLAAYFVGISLGQLIYGPLSDQLGRKKPLYVGLVIFMLASAGCAVCHSLSQLIALRFLQALGGCAEMVIARAIVRDRFDARDATRVYAGMMLIMGVAPIVAPLAGGWMAVHTGWRSVFWVLTVFPAICLVGVFMLPETLAPQRRVASNFVQVLKRYRRILGHRQFMAHTGTASFGLMALFAYVGGSPFMLLSLFHVPADHFGIFFGINAVGIISGSQINGQLVRRFEPHKVMRIAMIISCCAAAVLLFTLPHGRGGMVATLVPLYIFMSSLGFIFPTATALAMQPMGEQAGNASSVMGCCQFLLSGLGGMFVSAVQGTTAWPMASVIAGGVGFALICDFLGPREDTVDPRKIHFEPVELEG